MTIAVAYKDGNKVWVGADSQSSKWMSKRTLNNKNNCKLIIPEKEKNTIIAGTGYAKMINALNIQDRFIDELSALKGEFDYKYMVKTITPKIFNILDEFGLVDTDKNNSKKKSFEGSIIFAHKDKLFLIESNGYTIEIEDYVAIGSVEFHSVGHLNMSEYKDKKEAVINSIKSAIMSARGVGYPIVISNTEMNGEIEIISE